MRIAINQGVRDTVNVIYIYMPIGVCQFLKKKLRHTPPCSKKFAAPRLRGAFCRKLMNDRRY